MVLSSAVISALFFVAIPIVIKVLLALGFGFASYTGAEFAVTQAETYVLNHFSGMPSAAFQIMSMAGFLEGFKIVFAAYTSAIGLKVTFGAFSKMTLTKPV